MHLQHHHGAPCALTKKESAMKSRLPFRYLSPLAVLLLASDAFAQSQGIVQKFTGPLDFAAPIIGSIGALAVIGGIIAKGGGQQQGGNMALGAGVLFIIATFLMKTYSSWAGLFFN